MNTYNNLLLETKIYLNKELYENKLITYNEFERVERELIERMDSQ